VFVKHANQDFIYLNLLVFKHVLMELILLLLQVVHLAMEFVVAVMHHVQHAVAQHHKIAIVVQDKNIF